MIGPQLRRGETWRSGRVVTANTTITGQHNIPAAPAPFSQVYIWSKPELQTGRQRYELSEIIKKNNNSKIKHRGKNKRFQMYMKMDQSVQGLF